LAADDDLLGVAQVPLGRLPALVFVASVVGR